MVERLKVAIEKARASRAAGGAPAIDPVVRPPRRPPAARDAWLSLPEVALDADHLESERIVSHRKSDPAHVVFDVLRTRLMRVLKEKGWRRVLVTSPSKGCGKTVVCCNMALSLSRQADYRTILVDADLRSPRIASCLGLDRMSYDLPRYLRGEIGAEEHFVRVGQNLALGLNTEPVRDSAELISDAQTVHRLGEMVTQLKPDAVIHELPPLLLSDDALAFLGSADCVLLVAAANQTRPEEIEECERLLADNTNYLGVLLNKCDDWHGKSKYYAHYS